MSDPSHRAPAGAPPCAARTPDTNRRRFLMFGAGAASAAAAAPLVTATPGAVVAEPVAQPDAKGYSETQHVRDYYATARI
jgi:hypothetical protein